MNGARSTALAPLAPTPHLDMPLAELGRTMAASGFFKDTREAAQCIVKILAGREMGFGPVASMTGIYIVEGKVTLSSNLLAAAIKRSGKYDYRVRELTATRCVLEFLERGTSLGLSEFTWDDAVKAGLGGKNTWRQYPRNMLFSRCLSNGARWYCADIFGGPLYTPEELGQDVDPDTGEVVEVVALAPELVSTSPPQREPEPEPEDDAPLPEPPARLRSVDELQGRTPVAAPPPPPEPDWPEPPPHAPRSLQQVRADAIARYQRAYDKVTAHGIPISRERDLPADFDVDKVTRFAVQLEHALANVAAREVPQP